MTPQQIPSTEATRSITLRVVTGDAIPSFKNRKRSGINRRTGKLMSYTEAKVKKRSLNLEEGILSSLRSFCQTADGATDGECVKQLQTVLSALSDDSLKEMPVGGYRHRRVAKGEEGVEIKITKL